MASPGLFGDIWSVQSISTPRHTARSLQLWAEQARLLSAGELFHGLNRGERIDDGIAAHRSLFDAEAVTRHHSCASSLNPKPLNPKP